MGPPHECDGELERHERRLSARLLASMGPPHECDGELGDLKSGAVEVVVLQWGRRTNATERRQRGRRAIAVPQASMGPPHECDGEAEIWEQRTTGYQELQWGRRTNATERRRYRARGGSRRGFNGAAARMRRRGEKERH